jgi:hypothetical protein
LHELGDLLFLKKQMVIKFMQRAPNLTAMLLEQ